MHKDNVQRQQEWNKNISKYWSGYYKRLLSIGKQNHSSSESRGAQAVCLGIRKLQMCQEMLSPLVLRWLDGLGGQSIGRWSLAMRSLSGRASKGGLGYWIRGLRSPKKASTIVVFTMWWVEPKRTFTLAASWECDAASYRQETPGDAGKAGVSGCLGQGKQPRVQPARVGVLEGQVGCPV